MRRAVILTCLACVTALPALAAETFRFDSIDGGSYSTDEWRGQPVLVANTASLCAFTPQYDALQALYDEYRDEGLVVLAVPSDDFAQELSSDDEVRDFCAINFNLDLPMTVITPVTGASAHPFYAWLRDDHNVVPRWNFNKVLLDADGALVASYGSLANPMGPRIRADVEALLAR
ncbi:glutathione peroxidase [Rhodophyticola porphyridii]|uniref:Glutathione peroxidase n=1 Tax=Rhodophyticola porphyridii TaxID=1852017 RepID=A0A3L9Y6F5_9RHOB|nr:glutathione peroxidase [Rhodophyticola porphyridii]RMA41696.1 glutathione peroxidase [Rhodophyticola porphyridii]